MKARRRRQRKPVIPITDLELHQQPYVGLSALQAYWNVSARTVLKWIANGNLAAYRFGRQWRVKVTDAVAFEERSRVSHGTVIDSK
jgi:excisionase family DNA binding protein